MDRGVNRKNRKLNRKNGSPRHIFQHSPIQLNGQRSTIGWRLGDNVDNPVRAVDKYTWKAGTQMDIGGLAHCVCLTKEVIGEDGRETTCSGCILGNEGQLAHIGPNGCLGDGGY